MENIDGIKIDVNSGIARFGGKRDRYMQSLLKFAHSLPGQKLDYTSPETLQMVHAIKGVAGNLSITTLFEKALACELLLRKEPTAEAYDAFYETCAEVGNKIKAWLEVSEEQQKQPEGSAVEYNDLTSRLKKALAEFDPTACEEIIHKLKQKSWPKTRSLELIYSLIGDYRYDDALALLNAQ